MSLVYLAGPITGGSYEQAVNWREEAVSKLLPIKGLSPMRCKDYLFREKVLASGYQDTILSTDKAITARDRFDCQRSDVVLMNLLESDRVSIGSMIEIGWADAARVPIVLVMSENNIHYHGMVNEICSFKTNTLEDGISVCKAILS